MKLFCKRILDVALALTSLIVCSPLLVVIAFMIWVDMGRPILFLQERPGYKGRLFKMVKFRTMREPSGGQTHATSDAERLTPLGRWLRRWSLDELPELWNVLKGDMSMVGPRPLLTQYLGRYTQEQARRHEVLPGLTGWAQVNGRNAIGWEERFRMDVWYVDHWNPLLDLQIICKTVLRVLSGKGISSDGHATMPEFHGTGENLDT